MIQSRMKEESSDVDLFFTMLGNQGLYYLT